MRREGIDAILDQYEEAPSEGWPRWMENSINRADYVIVIGSKGYYDKIYGNVDKIKIELNILNSLIGSQNIEEEFNTLIDKLKGE